MQQQAETNEHLNVFSGGKMYEIIICYFIVYCIDKHLHKHILVRHL